MNTLTTRLTQLALMGALAAGAACAAAQDASADQLIKGGLQVLGQIDNDRAAEVWNDAAPFVKSRFAKAAMAADLQKARAAVGTVSQRTWASVNRVQFNESTPQVPAGLYANVDFSTRLTDGRTVFEKVSFLLGSDGVWRVVGYEPRQAQ